MHFLNVKHTTTDLKALSPTGLEEWVMELGEPNWRARQILRWMYAKKSVDSFESMLNLPVSLRDALSASARMERLKVQALFTARDQTVKALMQLPSGRNVESVLIPYLDDHGNPIRLTVCVSSQVGCAMGCTFCATGKMGFQENLTCGQIVDQVTYMRTVASERFDRDISNVVYMGMGEPLLNYKALLASLEILTHPEACGLSPRRITVSTVGLARRIRDLANDAPRVNLAVSLHAPTESKRASIMPISRNALTGLKALEPAMQYHTSTTGRPLTFEYCLFSGFNDSLEDASILAQICHNVRAKVNLIMYNSVPETAFERTSEKQLDKFMGHLSKRGVTVTVRRSRGADIAAACGQLANQSQT
ncbi:MAG: 23S rRNA (adenine(2503)-C(2))-methyltransferase RlmN [Rhodothermaceae bacterium]|nr:23S rRNA (adenine(2503)-C(2))-methyltransferase RlmN [Rhodothermaceae bacterium]MYF40509.1 23S rRNA (adenine(2503)-C(2))-methyltransferase RlmN [Rhodothermaceae bacterium]MYH07074.1 23S rRNA (adenine(2503)-C(2))-methyltransferase RlmN [Rhodothermaceae bacterium]